MSGDLPQHVVKKVLAVVKERTDAGPDTAGVEDAFFVADLESLDQQMDLWRTNLPGTSPHYAVKCNNHPEILRRLVKLGSHFDCASRHEIDLVLGLGALPDHIVYANPVKAPSELRYAQSVGIKRMTFDNAAELDKVKQHAPQSELLIRIATDDSGAVCSLSVKYGASITSQTEALLRHAKSLDLNVVGLAYHVGSGGGTGPQAHVAALKDAALVFEEARRAGYEFKVLDFGGGFEAEADDFVAIAQQIRKSISETQFPAGLKLMGEPGRFFAARTLVLVANVIGLRRAPSAGESDMVYISDGIYGNLNSIIYDHQHPAARLVDTLSEPAGRSATSGSYSASLWGPTCDGLDQVTKSAQFPRRLEVGDWLYFPHNGAYTLVGESAFNGFNTNTHVYIA